MNAVLQPHTPEIDLGSPAAAQAALRTFWRLAEAWQLDVNEQTTLLGVGRTTLYQWKGGKVGPLDRHVLERLSYLFGIYAALQILLPLKQRADEWVRQPNAAPQRNRRHFSGGLRPRHGGATARHGPAFAAASHAPSH